MDETTTSYVVRYIYRMERSRSFESLEGAVDFAETLPDEEGGDDYSDITVSEEVTTTKKRNISK